MIMKSFDAFREIIPCLAEIATHFKGEDTRNNFVGHLYEALEAKCIKTYKDDEKIEKGERINDQLLKSIKESRFFIIIFSKTYASSSWCLQELVKIMECQMDAQSAYPVFFDVEPTKVRKQSGPVGEAFSKHENHEAAGKWRDAMKELADLAGWELKATACGDESELIQLLVDVIFKKKFSTLSNADGKLVGMETRISEVISSLEIGIEDVRMIGIRGMGELADLAGWELKATANGDESKSIQIIVDAIFKKLHSTNSSAAGKLVGMETRIRDVLSSLEIGTEDVRMIGIKGMGGGGKTTLARAVYDRISTMFEGKSFVENVREVSKPTLSGLKKLQKRILKDVLNKQDISFGSVHDGRDMLIDTMHRSRVIITTRDEQVLLSHRVNFVHDVNLLSHEEAICLFSRYAFQKEIPIQGYEELSEQVVQYANGLPLTIKVLGHFFVVKISLNGDYAIKVLECSGFHARNGLKVLEQRSLITIYENKDEEYLGMHDHIEEMGKNIVRREHPDEPNKHSHLWIYEEIEDILANDMGTKATRCLKLIKSRGNGRIPMKGLGKMKKLRYLDVIYADSKRYDGGRYPKFDDTSQLDYSTRYFPYSLKYLKCRDYPFFYPRTFQANNLIGLEMKRSRMVQLWEAGEKKVLKKLKFLYLSNSNLTTFDFRISPNLETLILEEFFILVELCIPVLKKLKFLCLPKSKLTTFDFRITPNLERDGKFHSGVLGDSDQIEMTFQVESRGGNNTGDEDDDMGDDGEDDEDDDEDEDIAEDGTALMSLADTDVEDHDETGLGDEYNDDMVDEEEDDEYQENRVIEHPLLLRLGRGPGDGRWTDDGQPQAGGQAAPIAQAVEEHFILHRSSLRRLDLELIPNLERLQLQECHELEEINAPIGCLKKVVYLNLSGCLRFTDFVFHCRSDSKVNCYSDTLHLVDESLDSCPLHPNTYYVIIQQSSVKFYVISQQPPPTPPPLIAALPPTPPTTTISNHQRKHQPCPSPPNTAITTTTANHPCHQYPPLTTIIAYAIKTTSRVEGDNDGT
nr:disease resistance protein (TIR-NBS-LRR class) family [Tanacetum cinerariifolium]